MQVKAGNEKPHQAKISSYRNGAIREVKSQQPAHRSAGVSFGPVQPGPALVPDEVMNNSTFHRHGGGGKIVHAEAAREQRQRDELDAHSKESDHVELEPHPKCAAHTPDICALLRSRFASLTEDVPPYRAVPYCEQY